MATTLDHLCRGLPVHALKDLHDAHGRLCPAGFTGHVVHLQLDGRTQSVALALRPADGPTLTLTLDRDWFAAHQGQTMHAYFEATGPVAEVAPAARPPAATPTPRSGPAPAPPAGWLARLGRVLTPPPTDAPPASGLWDALDTHLAHALSQVRAGRPEDATAQWVALTTQALAPHDWGASRTLAEHVQQRAMALREPTGHISEPTAWAWLKDTSLHHWHAWGAQATSGGEGAAMNLPIKAAYRAFDDAERAHAQATGAPPPPPPPRPAPRGRLPG